MGESVTKGNGSCVPMDGKPRNRARKWRLTVSCGKDRRTGKYIRRTRVAYGTQTEARAALRDFIAELERERPRSSMTLCEWLDVWHSRRAASGKIAPTTVSNEASRLKKVAWLLGDVKLSDLTPAKLEEAYMAMGNGDTPSGKPLSGTTVRLAHINLKTALSDAVRDGLIDSNPLDAVKPPKRDTEEREALTESQLSNLVKSLDPSDYMERCILIMATTGIRRGEACALLWEDVDGLAVRICKAMDAQGNVRGTKTGGSRTVVIPQAVSDAIEPYRDRPLCPVVSPGAAEHAHPEYITAWWGKNRKRLGCAGVKLHGLRHSYITQLSRAGVPVKVAQELAGHSSAAITLDIYTHASMEDKLEAAQAFSHVFHTER